MSAEQLDNPVSYHQLEELEDEFEEVELELIRQQTKLTKDLLAKREKLISQIPNFWPLVFEQAPPDVDEYVQPSDAVVLANSLVSLTVERFELPGGDPRSIAIRWEFSENDYFEDKVLEKKFWWRRHRDGWAGLVSEPVTINWKKGKDLTGGMLDLAKKVYEEDKAAGDAKPAGETEAKKALNTLMEKTGLNGVSFFCWFGFAGRKVSEEENKEAIKLEQEKRKALKEGKEVDVMDEDNEDEDDDEDDEYEYEIFPTADDLAVFLAEDLYPGAIKYFLTAQEQDGMSDLNFESDDEMEDGDEDKAKPPSKKRKA
ncbi:nucleosome assembly protein [Stachybotrys elegans]|uniref:Nucleosome assembly protein n=1 Tax=Stachybotrys elegans TaxID=80388 RepID=A0A8K0SS77_9HYPO|nr:nucleosome assembly protein [Stachybotrys elegans]